MAGPREQFRPTTSAPAASSCRAASATLDPSRIRPSRGRARVITAGLPRALDRLERQEGLPGPAVGLAHDEVDAGVHRPVDLLVEDPARLLVRLRVVGPVDARVADVPREQGAGLARDLLREAERRAVDPLEVALPVDHPHLGAMRVVGERLDDVRARVHEVPVEALHQVRMLEDHLRHERAGLEIAAALELEEIPLGADHGPLGEPLHQPRRLLGSRLGHPLHALLGRLRRHRVLPLVRGQTLTFKQFRPPWAQIVKKSKPDPQCGADPRRMPAVAKRCPGSGTSGTARGPTRGRARPVRPGP